MRKIGLNSLAIVGGLAGAFIAGPALAKTYSLSIGNSAISPWPAPYGSVDVTLVNSTTADVTFSADDQTSGGITYDYFFIDTGLADVNVNATSWTINNLSSSCSGIDCGAAPSGIADNGAKNVDGFGKFNQTTKQDGGFGNRATAVSFTLTDTSGIWASDASVLTANSQGNTVAAHIAICDSTSFATCDAGALATGFAADGTPSIPEPSTWAMLALGFMGLGYAVFRRAKKESVALA